MMENSVYCKFVIIFTIVSVCFVFGFQFSNLNPLVPVMNQLFNQTYYKRYGVPIPEYNLNLYIALAFSILPVGSIFGCLSFNIVVSKLTRKQLMVLLHVLTVLGTLTISLGAGLSGSYEAFIIGRFVLGFIIGWGVIMLPIIIGETSEYQSQPFYMSLIGIGVALAVFSAPCFAHPKVLGTSELWPAMMTLSLIPSVLYLIAIPWLPETPYEVLRKEGRDSAKKWLMKLRQSKESENFEESIDSEIDRKVSEQARKSDKHSSNVDDKVADYVGIKEILKTKQYRWQFSGVLAVNSFLQLSGINNVFFYSDSIFTTAGIASDQVTFWTIGGMAMMVVGAVMGSFLVNRFGERKVLLGMSFIICIGTTLILVGLAIVHLAVGMAYVAVVGVAAIFFGFGGGPNTCLWPLMVSITTEPSRPIILLICGAAQWFFGWLVGFVAPYLNSAIGPYGLLIWLTCSVLFIIYCWFFIPETKGKTSEEIQEKFQ